MTTYASSIYNFVGRRLSWSNNGTNAERRPSSHDLFDSPSSQRPLSLSLTYISGSTPDLSLESDSDQSDSDDAVSEQTIITVDTPAALRGLPIPGTGGLAVTGDGGVDNTLVNATSPHSGFSPPSMPPAEGTSQALNSPTTTTMRATPLPEDDGQKALRQLLLEIQKLDISEREKARKMHMLMTQKYNACRKHKDAEPHSHPEVRIMPNDPLSITPEDAERTYHKDSELGCSHYKRGVKLQCSSCAKWYTCRFCHDEKEDHKLLRKETKNMLCMHCGKAQPAQQDCRHCGVRSARYYCDKCKLWDDDPEKKIYHCDDCGICRIGAGLGKDFFHCKKCGVCMSITLQDFHRCIERSTECDCPICGEYMFTSTLTVVFMKCGHSIHHQCYYEHMKNSYRCPTCTRTIANMESQFRALDNEIIAQPLPPPYDAWRCLISCNDCSARSNVPFHFLGLKCETCRSYNTSQLKLFRPEDDSAPPALGSHVVPEHSNAPLQPQERISPPMNLNPAPGGGVLRRAGTSPGNDIFVAASAAIVSADAAIDMVMENRRTGRENGLENGLLYDDGWGSAEDDSTDESDESDESDRDCDFSDRDSSLNDDSIADKPDGLGEDLDDDEDDDEDDDFLNLTGHR